MKKNNLIIVFLTVLIFAEISFSQSVIDTKHNLSVTGPGTIKAASESEVCIFCHTPHGSSPRTPLWNKQDPGLNYTLYTSSTTQGNIGQPDRSSLLCLSCHDGTIALGNVLSRSALIEFSGGVTTMPPGNTNLTKVLADDHPISFLYNSALATQDGQLVDPSTLTGPVKLENGNMECTACHDPHENPIQDFLVASNQYSDLCLYCHDVNYWDNSSHKTSNANWNTLGTDPWFHTEYTTVSENACENCHNPHNAEEHVRIRNFIPEENNCLVCHNGNVATKNIQTQINKIYPHAVYNYLNDHDPEEPNIVQTRHVECEDCHNPHAVDNTTANPPNANGFIQGVKGVDTDGNDVSEILYEYELCYRCHADSPDKPVSPTGRVIEQNNVRLEFDINNPAYHPIEGPGKNTNVISLLPPYTVSSIIYCTDCHASDGDSSPVGPHGSIYPQILKYNYERVEWVNTYFAYELCFKCHDQNIITSVHQQIRISHARKTSCNTCHDPHGINSAQGNITNNAYIINFNSAIVTPGALGIVEYEDLGTGHGKCTLKCHNHDHDPATY